MEDDSKAMSTKCLGLRSGMCSVFGFLPHILVMFFLFIKDIKPYLVPLLGFTILSKLLGEYFFWNTWYARRDAFAKKKNLEITVDRSVFSHPNILVSLGLIVADTVAEGALVLLALKTSISPFLILLILLGFQAISSPIQGFVSDLTSRKKSLLFAMIATMIAVAVMGEINIEKSPGTSSSSLINLLYLYPFSHQTQVIIVLCIKAVFGNGAVLARAAMAEVIEVETEKRLV